jgi:hypothetical protein
MTADPRAATAAALDGRAALNLTIRFLALNAPFALALAGLGWLPGIAQPLIVGAIIFLLPGLAWTKLDKGDGVIVLFRVVVLSLPASLAAWLVLMPLPGPTDRVAFILVLAAITNAGLVLGVRRNWLALDGLRQPLSVALLVAGGLFYVQSYVGAAHFVPPIEDQDMETQGTAYGLINEAAPTMVTDRDSRFFFAHPLLLHFWIGESALISGDLDRLKHYHDSSEAMRGDPAPEVLYAEWERSLARFYADPVLLPTRTPNIFLALLIVFPLGFLVFRLTGSRIAAVGAAALYATLPEIYVRTSYGGYLSVTNFLLVSGAYFYLHASRLFPDQKDDGASNAPARRFGFASAFLAGWTDQKGILVPLAAPVHAGLRALIDLGPAKIFTRAWTRKDVLAAIAVTGGFFAGWAVYVAFGLSVAPSDFVRDHIQAHIVERMQLDSVEIRQVESWYPSILKLWREFADHTGWFLSLAAIPAGIYALRRVREGEGFLLIWAVIGAVGFSLVDWRQTKHLAHILPAIIMMTAVYWASLSGRLRMAMAALLVVAFTWNTARTGMQMADFEFIKPSPTW